MALLFGASGSCTSADCAPAAARSDEAVEDLGLLQFRQADQEQQQGEPRTMHFTPCFSGVQTVAEFRACLASVPIDAFRRDCALEVIFGQLRSLYTYSDLVRNSSDHDAELDNGFDFKVHNISLGDILDTTYAKLKEETSAGILALELSKMFVKFQDAHTAIYSNPLIRTHLLPPVTVKASKSNVSQELEFTVTEVQPWASSSLVGKTLSTVNGQAALSFFLELAASKAIDKSRGTQLNRYLKGQKLSGSQLPDGDGDFNVVFTDGTTSDLAWMVNVSAGACGLGDDYRICDRYEVMFGNCSDNAAIMEQCFTQNQDFDDMVAMMETLGYGHLTCTSGGTPAKAAVQRSRGRRSRASAAEAAPEERVVPGSPEESPEEEIPMRMRGEKQRKQKKDRAAGLGENNTEEDTGPQRPIVPIERIMGVDYSCDVLKVDLEDGTSAVVLKIVSFGPFSELLPCANAAVSIAANVSQGKLIIDVIGNGGGYVSSGYLLNHFLYSKLQDSPMKHSFQACEWYDLPLNDELSWFVTMAQKGLPRLADEVDPATTVRSLAERMNKAVQALSASDEMFGRNRKFRQLLHSASCLQGLLGRFEVPPSPAVSGETTGEWKQFESLYNQCVEIMTPLGGTAGMAIMGYAPSNKFPDEMSEPNWDYYTNVVTKKRGGAQRNFSSMTFLASACDGYQAAYPEMYGRKNMAYDAWPYPAQNNLTQITYLSDGTCGSTCSVSSSTPFLEGLSTFVTYGGVPGESMDITSFNGGNVGTYQSRSWSIWKEALDHVIDMSLFHPQEAPPAWPFLPVPLNLYKVRFAQRAEYPRPLGSRALPREWYEIPASFHLDMWTSDNLRYVDEFTADAWRTLYGIYRATAALPNKPLGRHPRTKQA